MRTSAVAFLAPLKRALIRPTRLVSRTIFTTEYWAMYVSSCSFKWAEKKKNAESCEFHLIPFSGWKARFFFKNDFSTSFWAVKIWISNQFDPRLSFSIYIANSPHWGESRSELRFKSKKWLLIYAYIIPYINSIVSGDPQKCIFFVD